MKKKNRGFSLIELIIAIAILLILTGLLAPQFMKYMEKARKASCLHAMDVIAEEYMAKVADLGKAPDEETAVNLLSEIIVEHGGVRIGVKARKTPPSFSGSPVYVKVMETTNAVL